MTTAAPPPTSSEPPWKIAVELLGALAGVVIVVSLVGGLVLAARLHALGLPIDATVALLPKNALLVAGIHAVALGFVLAVVVLVAIHAIDPVTRRASRGRRRLLTDLLILLVVVVPVALPVLLEPLTRAQRLGLVAVAVLVSGLALLAVHIASSYRQLAYVLAALVLLLAAALHSAGEWLAPTEMDFVSIRMTSGDTTDGYYLAGDGSTIFIVPNVGTRSIRVITALPRGDISSIDLLREDTPIRPIGTELSEALIGRFASPSRLPRERKARRDELQAYAAEIRSDGMWRFPPIVPVASLQYLLDHYKLFHPGQVHPDPSAGDRLPLRLVLRDPRLFVGRSMVVRGEVVQSVLEDTNDGIDRRFLIVRPPHKPSAQASCVVSRFRPWRVRAGQTIDLRATVVAWGSVDSRTGKRITATILACGGARLQAPSEGRKGRRTRDDEDG
jgi:hypothetical protein